MRKNWASKIGFLTAMPAHSSSKLILYLCGMQQLHNFVKSMNALGEKRTPFLFVIDFDMKKPMLFPLNEINPQDLLFELNGVSNANDIESEPLTGLDLKVSPPSEEAYEKSFTLVMKHLRRGDSYLLNLTQPVSVKTNLGLKEIFFHSRARYKLWIKDQFTVFSPEPFVKIENGLISTHPMKGTIDALIPDAESRLLHDMKELAEHYTIVDLLRNDLNMVAQKVRVEKFRYVEEIITTRGKLLQTSSLITGQLGHDALNHLGDIMLRLLPAGSVTGAPKRRTVEIIHEAEGYDRGYYTGIFGLFDGKRLDSAVMIRFVESSAAGLIFKAGGGITVNSLMVNEYKELIQKVYFPIPLYT